jgi:hypothetical protein
VFDVNDAHVITGWYSTEFDAYGYVRDRNDSYTTFDVPGSYITGGIAINAGGTISGAYATDPGGYHGMVRERSGTITTYDIPGENLDYLTAINPRGLIVGSYSDSMYTEHAYLRDRNGAINTVDPPAGTGITTSGFAPSGRPLNINPEGRIAGTYWQPIPNNPFGGNEQGFVRHTDGTFEMFAAANYGPCCIWTWATGIAPNGTVVGYEKRRLQPQPRLRAPTRR